MRGGFFRGKRGKARQFARGPGNLHPRERQLRGNELVARTPVLGVRGSYLGFRKTPKSQSRTYAPRLVFRHGTFAPTAR